MEILALLFLIGFLILGNQIASKRREDALARRLEKMHDPELAMLEADRMIGEAKRENASFDWLRRHHL